MDELEEPKEPDDTKTAGLMADEQCPKCKGEIDYKEGNEWKICQDCCPHDELDHGICLSCGRDCFDDLVDRAEFLRDCAEDR